MTDNPEKSLLLDWLYERMLVEMRRGGLEVFLDYLKGFDHCYSVVVAAYRICSSVSWEDAIDKAFVIWSHMYGTSDLHADTLMLWDRARTEAIRDR